MPKWAELTPEQYEQRCKDLSQAAQRRWSRMTPDERKAYIAPANDANHERGSHADCTHPMTPAARRLCRNLRKREQS